MSLVLSEAFLQTVEAIREIGDARLQVAVLSATPGRPPRRPLGLSDADRRHECLSARLNAKKPARLSVAKSSRPEEEFAAEARRMMGNGVAPSAVPLSVGVIVNRIALARAIFKILKHDENADAVLMIGRSRDVDRSGVVERLEPFLTGADRSLAPRPLYVVATQCLEVGVDLDFDGLVTQAAPLDALRQRFGRLARNGRNGATAAILALPEDLKAKADDPVYGDRISTTWQALGVIAENGAVDFGITALPERLAVEGIDIATLSAPRENAPVLMPAYVDLWSHTSPIPAVDPDVGLFLHGPERGPADISVIWRADVLPEDLAPESGVDLAALMALVPPRASEAIALPVWTVRRWLARGLTGLGDLADAPMRAEDVAGDGGGRPAFRWVGPGDARTGVVDAQAIRPGDVIVVPAQYGGCDAFGWAPDVEEPVADVAATAAYSWRRRRWAARLRIPPDLDVRQSARAKATLTDLGRTLTGAEAAALSVFAPADEESRDGPGCRDEIALLADAQSSSRRPPCDVYWPYGVGDDGLPRGGVIVARSGLEDDGEDEDDIPVAHEPATEDDARSATGPERLRIDAHGESVAAWARRYVDVLKPAPADAADIVLAARLHDLGKADRRFQVALAGGDPWNAPDDAPVAKSAAPVPPQAFTRAGLPKGWRHEALSVRLARVHPELDSATDPLLVLWLIGTHHGLGRPFFGFTDPLAGTPAETIAGALGVTAWAGAPAPGPQSPAFDFDGFDWPALFDVLKARYGTWGLAHLEAIVRLADHRASGEEGAA